MSQRSHTVEACINAKVFSLFALHKATQFLTSTLDLKLLTQLAVDAVLEMGHSKNGAFYLKGEIGEDFRLAAAKSVEGIAFPAAFGCNAPLVRTAEDRLLRPFLWTLVVPGGEALVVPLALQDMLAGFFVLQGRVNPAPWNADDLEMLETLASHVGLCLQNARLYQQVNDQYEALKAAQAQLVQTEKLATMGQLLAGVAHELNNPLSVVMGQTFLLQEMVGDGPLAGRAQKILQAADRCARIVKNFLALARQRPPERQLVQLNQVIREAVELLAYPLRVDTIEVSLDLQEDLPVLWADPHQLHQVLVNLISNAHQALHETSLPRRLTIHARGDALGSRVYLQVTDTGPGIPPEVRLRLFEPFFTTKPPGLGTGLGLSICQGIVEGHGGTIGVESTPGEGAVFTVELPIRRAPTALAPAQGPAAMPSLGQKAILVVDDEPDIAETLADMLAVDGHRVDTAANGRMALDRLREQSYDLILSDLRMPELDGLGLYRELEQHHPALARRVVFLTGDTLGVETREFLEQIRAPGLSKPCTLEAVRRALQRVLQGGEA